VNDALVAACRRAFPGRDNLRIANLAEINEGWECQVFAFDLRSVGTGQPATENLILRIFQGSQAAAKCTGEGTALDALARAGFPVPSAFYRETEPGIEGKPFILMERIPGPQLGDLLRAADTAERDVLWRRFCRLFAGLHVLDWRPLVPDAAEREQRDEVAGWIATGRRIAARWSEQEFDPVFAWLEEHRPAVERIPPSVTHGDYHPWNILCPAPDRLVVIDWTSADIFDFRFDLAWTLLLITSSVGMETRDRVLADYEQARGAPVRDLAFFEVMAATRRLGDIIISLRHGAEAMGMRPGAESLMAGENRHLRAAYELLTARTGLTIASLAGIS
jgi:aminoglycoside phosphotransferase (APT) family kinase protein